MTVVNRLHELTVYEAAALISAHRLSPSDYLEAILARIGAVEDRVRAWRTVDFDGARLQASILAKEADAGRVRGPLHGVPVGIKEQFAVGSLLNPAGDADTQLIAPGDATVVARLRVAGAVVLGTTIMLRGDQGAPTRNPWNLDHTPGGSSSGSAAAVSSRMVPIALAEQTGGSTLRPAAFCGVTAFKPTFGRVSRNGMSLLSYSQDHVGLIGLSVEDIALVFSVIAGPDALDPTTTRTPAPVASTQPAIVAPPRIGIVRNFFPERTEPNMQSVVDAAAGRLSTAGAKVREVELPLEFGLTWPTYRLTFGAESAIHRAAEDAAAATRGPLSFDTYGAGARALRGLIPATYYLQSQRIRRWLVEIMLDFFRREAVDVLLTATAPGPAPQGLENFGDPVLDIPWSHLGFPAINIQSGSLSPEGLPLGLQFAAPRMADAELLRAGTWIERTLGRLPPPPLD